MKDWKEYKTGNRVWYGFYILFNIFTLGTFWFIRNLISYAVHEANKK